MPANIPDYSIKIQVRNAWFLRKMRDAGYETVAQLSRACGINSSLLGEFVNIKRAGMTTRGKWSATVIKVSEVLACLPEDLFPPQHVSGTLARNTVEIAMTASDVVELMGSTIAPDRQIELNEVSTALSSVFHELTPREERVLRLRFGFEGESQTLDEIAALIGTGRERVRQIEAKAFRKCRHPSRVGRMLGAFQTLKECA